VYELTGFSFKSEGIEFFFISGVGLSVLWPLLAYCTSPR
jgi:hypothetical protein